MPADASINSQVTACPLMFSLCLHACSAPDLSRDACRVRRCHRGDVQMSMDSNSFSVLSDNQKVYKSALALEFLDPVAQQQHTAAAACNSPQCANPTAGITCKCLAARWLVCGHTDLRAWKHGRTAVYLRAHACNERRW
jgi:hypothetical protein